MTVGQRITLIDIAIYQTLAMEANPEDLLRAIILVGLQSSFALRDCITLDPYIGGPSEECLPFLEECICLADVVASTAGVYNEIFVPNCYVELTASPTG